MNRSYPPPWSSPTIRPKRRLAVTRRDLFRGAAAAAAGAAALPASPQSPAPQSGSGPAASLHWLSGAAPFRETGVSFGVPPARGRGLAHTDLFAHSVRCGHVHAGAAVAARLLAGWIDEMDRLHYRCERASANSTFLPAHRPRRAPPSSIRYAAAITIDTGKLQARSTSGSIFLDDVTVDSRRVAGGKLVASLEDRSAADTLHFPAFTSSIGKATLEQSGPVRAVVKIEGVHRADRATAPRPGARPVAREFLPFTLRLYFYAGSDAVRLIHSFVFDGDDKKDFIKSLGLSFSVPMREQIHNRHVRFSGAEDGLWAEPVQPATGRRLLPGSPTQYADQLAPTSIRRSSSRSRDEGGKLLALGRHERYNVEPGEMAPVRAGRTARSLLASRRMAGRAVSRKLFPRPGVISVTSRSLRELPRQAAVILPDQVYNATRTRRAAGVPWMRDALRR